ncbi:site-specific integrase, partial [Bacteroidales bacterium OttesenSCG-928-L03]|nr:site-specific integrase [Bacteroidales bacterium OttesenSCG-928-L03]
METQMSFNLREPKSEKPTSIYLVCRINGKQIKIPIGPEYNIYPKHWNKESQHVMVNNSLSPLERAHNMEVNERLAECINLFNEWKQYIRDNAELVLNSEKLLRRFVMGQTKTLELTPVEWFNEYLEKHCTARETSKKQYEVTFNVFSNFLTECKIKLNSFSQFNLDVINSFEKYLIERGKKVTTINNYIANVLSFLKHAENEDLIDLKKTRIDRYQKISDKTKHENIVVLSFEEIESMYSLPLTGKKKVVRDIFVCQCYLGQRISDMGLQNAIFEEDKIQLIQQKTGTKVTIPLISDTPKKILLEYKNEFPQDVINSSSTRNKLIKEIAKEAGIMGEVLIKEQIGRKEGTKTMQRWECVKMHTARHSFTTNMLKMNVSSEYIKKITGHRTDSAFQAYNNLTSEDSAQFILS